MISPTATSTPRIAARSELLGYVELAWVVYCAANPSKRMQVLDLNEYRAIRQASIHLGVSAEKLRAHRIPGELVSAGTA